MTLQVLDGSGEGKLRNASERLGLVCAMHSLAAASKASAGSTAPVALDFLSSFYKWGLHLALTKAKAPAD